MDNLIWQVSVDHNIMSFIHKVHDKPRLHVSANLFGAWPPCCTTPPSSPLCVPVSNTTSHDNHEKINHINPLLSVGMGLRLASFGYRSSTIIWIDCWYLSLLLKLSSSEKRQELQLTGCFCGSTWYFMIFRLSYTSYKISFQPYSYILLFKNHRGKQAVHVVGP